MIRNAPDSLFSKTPAHIREATPRARVEVGENGIPREHDLSLEGSRLLTDATHNMFLGSRSGIKSLGSFGEETKMHAGPIGNKGMLALTVVLLVVAAVVAFTLVTVGVGIVSEVAQLLKSLIPQ